MNGPQKIRQKSILYSALAVSFLSMHEETNAQVIYVDIEPDIILDEGGQVDELDLDINATIDFWFHNNSFTFYDYVFDSYWTMQNILAGPEVSQNAMAGISQYYSTAYSQFTRYFPYALSSGKKIGDSLSMQNADVQIMALREYFHYGEDIFPCFWCYWYTYDLPDIIDHYLGVRFMDSDSINHYGWIRCDVKDEGRTLVINDYAYETKADWPIYAGDTLSYAGIDENENTLGAIVYSFEKQVYIKLVGDEKNADLHIYNTAGQKIYSDALNSAFHVIDLQQYSTGFYLVELQNEQGRYAKKVFVE